MNHDPPVEDHWSRGRTQKYVRSYGTSINYFTIKVHGVNSKTSRKILNYRFDLVFSIKTMNVNHRETRDRTVILV